MNKYLRIYNLIKKYNNIYIVRHIGPDPDALASQFALKEIILNTFPKKNVYCLGASVAKFKYFGKLDKKEDIDYDNSLVITVDVPDIKRVDGADVTKFKAKVKIDHHPLVDKYGDVEIIDPTASSASELLVGLVNKTRLKANKSAIEKIFMGIVSDSNRFLFCGSKTFKIISKLINNYKLNLPDLYAQIYARPLADTRLMGYIASNLIVNKDKLAYIEIPEDKLSEIGADASSASNMVNEFNNIKEVLVWLFITYDKKNNIYKLNIRSRGPIINEVVSKYNGGGHKYSCGARIETKKEVDKLLEELSELCKKYDNEKK